MQHKNYLLLLALLGLAGCSTPLALRQSERETHNLTAARLENLQLFTSQRIVLEQQQTVYPKVKNGRLSTESDLAWKNRVVIPQRTKCLALFVTNDFVLVNFEGDPNASLYYVKDDSKNGLYVLGTTSATNGAINYSDHLYTLKEGAGSHLFFYYQRKPLKEEERTVPGRKLPHYSWLKRLFEVHHHYSTLPSGNVGKAGEPPAESK
jgi:hypothetical protein